MFNGFRNGRKGLNEFDQCDAAFFVVICHYLGELNKQASKHLTDGSEILSVSGSSMIERLHSILNSLILFLQFCREKLLSTTRGRPKRLLTHTHAPMYYVSVPLLRDYSTVPSNIVVVGITVEYQPTGL